jgi:ferredoxin
MKSTILWAMFGILTRPCASFQTMIMPSCRCTAPRRRLNIPFRGASIASSTSSNDDDSSTPRKTHEIRWKTPESSDGDIVFHAHDGETLRTAALRRRKVSPHNGKARLINCRGLGTCGTCAVEITPQSSVEPRERNAVERARLNFPPHDSSRQSPNLRLACQVQVKGDLEVTKRSGFWGQYQDAVAPSKAVTYFGDLEFLMDRKSPPVGSRDD